MRHVGIPLYAIGRLLLFSLAIPLLGPATDASPLQGMSMNLSETAGLGDLPWDLHELSLEREEALFGASEPPPVLWFDMVAMREDELHRRSIALLGLIHLLGRNVAQVNEVWVYRRDLAPPQFSEFRPLQMPLRGKQEFFLPAGVSEEGLLNCYHKITRAIQKAPWLRITLEHLLLALDGAGLSKGLLDMTIALESLIRANTEVSFRFSHQIPRLATDAPSEFEEYQNLLSDLYAVRSSHVHGDDPGSGKKANVERHLIDLSRVMRRSVIYALEFHAMEHPRTIGGMNI